jgi:hypothetical protein
MRSIAGNGIFGFGYNIGTNLVLSFDDKKLMVLAITGATAFIRATVGPKRTCPTEAKCLLLTYWSPAMAQKRGFA